MTKTTGRNWRPKRRNAATATGPATRGVLPDVRRRQARLPAQGVAHRHQGHPAVPVRARFQIRGGEGCNVHGRVALSTGGGNLHIAPGHELEKFGERQDMFTSLLDLMTESFETFDVSHQVNVLRFGPDFPGAVHQLDGQDRPIADPYAMHQYYLQVVPTEYRKLDGTIIRSNQYSVTEHTRHVAPGSNRGLPGVLFFYEVSALHVQLEDTGRVGSDF